MSYTDSLNADVHPTGRNSQHFTRLWPKADGRPAEAPLFLAAVSPLRLLALSVLWATSSRGRLLCGLAAVLAVAAVAAVLL